MAAGAQESPIKRAIELAGGVAKVAELFGINRISVYQWIYGDRVPAERCPELEKACRGEVRCEQMNPDVDWKYLRSRAAAEPTRSHGG